MSQRARIEVPPKLYPVFSAPRGVVQYRAAHGGRGSGKSYTFALMAALWGLKDPIRILATRDFQSSIKESFHAELKSAICSIPWLEANYEIGVDFLRCKNGTEFIFRGLRHNISNIKSLAKIDLTIVEEAEDVSEESWLALEATVFRQPNAELWAIWNPLKEGSPVDSRFRQLRPDNALIAELNYYDNPYFPDGLETLRKREEERLDPATYAHIWLGDYLHNSNSQVLHGKVRVSDFEAESTWNGPYFGADWGFSQDPTAAVRAWVHNETLYIDYEAGKIGLELDHTAGFLFDRLPDIQRHTVRSDSARPETISYLKRHGMPRIEGVKKWPGSVEDGIAHLRSYKEIVIHPRCTETIKETRLYSYKVDRLTGDVLPTVIDANNHYIDAIRYALNPLIQRKQHAYSAVKVAGL